MPVPQSDLSGSVISSTLAAITFLIYLVLMVAIVYDVVLTRRRKRNRHPHKLTYQDYQKVLDDEFITITVPVWVNVSLGEFNNLASLYYKSFEKMVSKNREYACVLQTLSPDDPNYQQYVEAEYIIIESMTEIAAELCSKFAENIKDKPLGESECPHSVVQKYCTIVNCFKSQRTILDNEIFIPPELKNRYTDIADILFNLFDLLNSTITVF